MKRHPALQPLSREHQLALLHWRQIDQHIAKSDDSALLRSVEEIVSYWDFRFESHMLHEETALLPVLSDPLRRRLESEHRELRSFYRHLRFLAPSTRNIDSVDRQLITVFAKSLRAHIRWKERIVFPFIQDILSDDELFGLASSLQSEQTDDSRSNPVQDVAAAKGKS